MNYQRAKPTERQKRQIRARVAENGTRFPELHLQVWLIDVQGARVTIAEVERSGLKLEDILHKSKPWQDQDCDRPGCMKNLTQDCHERKVLRHEACPVKREVRER